MTDLLNSSDNGGNDDGSPTDKNRKSSDDIEESENDIKELLEEANSTTGELGQIVKTARRAAEAVKLLNIKWFFDSHADKIYQKLEECESYAERADFNGSMMFIALSLPVVNGIIHVASTRKDLQAATKWVLEEWTKSDSTEENPDPEKVPILSALTLIFIVSQGWKEYENDPKKRARWERIRDRVQQLSTESLVE